MINTLSVAVGVNVTTRELAKEQGGVIGRRPNPGPAPGPASSPSENVRRDRPSEHAQVRLPGAHLSPRLEPWTAWA